MYFIYKLQVNTFILIIINLLVTLHKLKLNFLDLNLKMLV
jgi:hypothetical protein